MYPLSTVQLLDVWERGQRYAPVQQALLLLGAACPEIAPEQLARLSIGQRDAQLLTLRERHFGTQLICLVACPACGQQLDLAFSTSVIRTPVEVPAPTELEVSSGDYRIRFRLPNSLDLLALQSHGAPVETQLIERCIVGVQQRGATLPAGQLPREVEGAIAAQMAEADPQADIRIALDCPACQHRWQALFDIVSFFWHEIDSWARRTLRDVHVLARAYGWREADILALSNWRRRYYLSMVQG